MTVFLDDENSASIILPQSSYQKIGSWSYYFLDKGAKKVEIVDLDCLAN